MFFTTMGQTLATTIGGVLVDLLGWKAPFFVRRSCWFFELAADWGRGGEPRLLPVQSIWRTWPGLVPIDSCLRFLVWVLSFKR